MALLTAETLRVAEVFDGAWCVDWALATDGQWYAIDMAEASQSFHWDGCTEASGLHAPRQEPAKVVDYDALLKKVDAEPGGA